MRLRTPLAYRLFSRRSSCRAWSRAGAAAVLISGTFWLPAANGSEKKPMSNIPCTSLKENSPNNLAFRRNCELGRGINLGLVLEKQIYYASACKHAKGSKRLKAKGTKPWDADSYLKILLKNEVEVDKKVVNYMQALKAAFNLEHVRLPVAWWHHRCKDGNIDPVFMRIVATIVDHALAAGLAVVLDLHEFNKVLKFDPANPKLLADFTKVWSQVGARFAAKDHKLYFELLNEPQHEGGFCPKYWKKFIKSGVDAIRASHDNNKERTLLLGSCNPNDADHIENALTDVIQELREQKGMNPLIAVFHTYDPFAATHWIDRLEPNDRPAACPPLKQDEPLPQPVPLSCASTDSEYDGDWERRNKDKIGLVAKFGDNLDVPISLNEIGFQRARANNPSKFVKPSARKMVNRDRKTWLRRMVAFANNHGMSWTIWNLYGQFGFVDHDGITETKETGLLLADLYS